MQRRLNDLRVGLFGSVLLLLTVGCGPQMTWSGLLHEYNQPIRSTEQWNWIRLDATMTHKIVDLALISKQDVIGSPHSVDAARNHKRLVVLFNEMDGEIRRFIEHGAEIPQPKLVVSDDISSNAHVLSAPVCFRFDEDLVSENSILLTWNGEVSEKPRNMPCVTKVVQKADHLKFIQWLNRNLGRCQIKTVSDELFYFGNGCKRNEGIGLEMPWEIVLYATSDVILASLSLLSDFTDDEVRAIFAHELAHYYRSHSTVAMDGVHYNYFYQLDALKNSVGKPLPVPELFELGTKVLNVRLPNQLYRRVPGQKLPSELYMPLRGIVSTIDAFNECGSSVEGCNRTCKNLAKKMDGEYQFEQFPWRQLGTEQIAKYLTYEDELMACLAQMHVRDSAHDYGREVSVADVVDALSWDAELYRVAWQDWKIESSKLIQVIREAENQLRISLEKVELPLREARDKRLGYYTVEQEADEIALEWISRLGLDLKSVLGAELKFARNREQRDLAMGIRSTFPFEIESSRCAELMHRDWQDEKGNPVFIPVADYRTLHHSSCFRVYNLYREIAAHGYSPRK